MMGDEEKPTDGTELPDGEVREVSGTESRGEAATDDTDGDRCPRSIGVVCQLREDLTITFVNGSTQVSERAVSSETISVRRMASTGLVNGLGCRSDEAQKMGLRPSTRVGAGFMNRRSSAKLTYRL